MCNDSGDTSWQFFERVGFYRDDLVTQFMTILPEQNQICIVNSATIKLGAAPTGDDIIWTLADGTTSKFRMDYVTPSFRVGTPGTLVTVLDSNQLSAWTTYGVTVSELCLNYYGGRVTINGGHGSTGDFRVAGESLDRVIFTDASAATENIALLTNAAPNWQTMDRGLFVGECSTAPTGNPAAGYFNYGADWNGAGTCVPFFRGEDGSIVKLFTGTTIADPSGGVVQDAEARTAINALIDRLQGCGLIA